MPRKLSPVLAAIALTVSLGCIMPEQAAGQGQSPTVSMVTLQVVPGQNGQEMVVTPRGQVVPLPGPGVNSNVVQVYMGSQGGYWYVDRNGNQVDLTGAVANMQARMQAANFNSQVPQYAPAPVTVNNYTSQNGESSGSSGSGGSGMGTAVAAGLGAATGAALTTALTEPNYWRGVPYGTPVYYGNGYKPYYTNHGGNNVYVDNQHNVNANANVNQVHANNYQQQQNWYNKQVKDNSAQYQNWQKSSGSNPFVHPDSSWANRSAAGNANYANRDAGAVNREAAANRDGGFANRDGGSFGNRGAGRRGGGRFR